MFFSGCELARMAGATKPMEGSGPEKNIALALFKDSLHVKIIDHIAAS